MTLTKWPALLLLQDSKKKIKNKKRTVSVSLLLIFVMVDPMVILLFVNVINYGTGARD